MASQQIAFFSLTQHIKEIRTELDTAIAQILDSQQFIGGKVVQNFEQKLASYLGANHVISCNSGTDALWMALHALETKKDDLILTTPFSFIASSSEIVAHGAHPVFIDVDKKTYNISPQILETWLNQNAELKDGIALHKASNRKIAGLLTVDLFGQVADYKKIKALAEQWNLWIIEDTAQAIGAEHDGKKAGTFGDIGTFSFYPTKNLGAAGDAGACVTNNPQLAEKLIRVRNHGRISHYNYEGLGINSRCDGIQAAILSVELDHLDKWMKRRAEIAQMYNQAFKDLPGVQIPQELFGKHVYHQYSLVIKSTKECTLRNELKTHLQEQGVGSNIFYEKAFYDIPFLNNDATLKTDCPVTQMLTQSIISLPVWPELTNEQVQYVIDCVKNAPVFTTKKIDGCSVNLAGSCS